AILAKHRARARRGKGKGRECPFGRMWPRRGDSLPRPERSPLPLGNPGRIRRVDVSEETARECQTASGGVIDLESDLIADVRLIQIEPEFLSEFAHGNGRDRIAGDENRVDADEPRA